MGNKMNFFKYGARRVIQRVNTRNIFTNLGKNLPKYQTPKFTHFLIRQHAALLRALACNASMLSLSNVLALYGFSEFKLKELQDNEEEEEQVLYSLPRQLF
eukprot:TRINITY_DN1740_c0_g1_i5.p3 TRINITY_DN1740_c0_g1~~TRINITY_DN1740_c0_g1_i5.p3  ORF type:complete len:101 (+),score=11.56 TRINITY_DN1740_c0_g1_i5:183-485(+)